MIEAKMIDLYAAFVASVGVELGSADEHLFDERLTLEQRRWLLAYIELWDAMVDLDRRPDDDGPAPQYEGIPQASDPIPQGAF